MQEIRITAFCPDCGASIGTPHKENCDIARCCECGGQALSCGCANQKVDTWNGYFPGTVEALKQGFFCKTVPPKIPGAIHSYEKCSQDDPMAIPDLNRVYATHIWDKDKQCLVLK